MRPASVDIVLLPTTAITGNGNGSTYKAAGYYSEMLLFLEVTAVGGTSPQLNVFIDVSDDEGTTWFNLTQLGPANIAAAPSAPYPSTYLLHLTRGNNTALFGNTMRVRYTLTGTNPTATLAVKGIAK